jgi:hypothetical protein
LGGVSGSRVIECGGVRFCKGDILLQSNRRRRRYLQNITGKWASGRISGKNNCGISTCTVMSNFVWDGMLPSSESGSLAPNSWSIKEFAPSKENNFPVSQPWCSVALNEHSILLARLGPDPPFPSKQTFIRARSMLESHR